MGFVRSGCFRRIPKDRVVRFAELKLKVPSKSLWIRSIREELTDLGRTRRPLVTRRLLRGISTLTPRYPTRNNHPPSLLNVFYICITSPRPLSFSGMPHAFSYEISRRVVSLCTSIVTITLRVPHSEYFKHPFRPLVDKGRRSYLYRSMMEILFSREC